MKFYILIETAMSICLAKATVTLCVIIYTEKCAFTKECAKLCKIPLKKYEQKLHTDVEIKHWVEKLEIVCRIYTLCIEIKHWIQKLNIVCRNMCNAFLNPD